jgi:hypothetical protein
MAMLHALIKQDPDARGKELLRRSSTSTTRGSSDARS